MSTPTKSSGAPAVPVTVPDTWVAVASAASAVVALPVVTVIRSAVAWVGWSSKYSPMWPSASYCTTHSPGARPLRVNPPLASVNANRSPSPFGMNA